MPELPKKKIGIISCSGEELAEGTISRLATLRVLEQLRPADTVTICLPLFLAGGEGDRAFAKFYPTIAVDGCDRRCAFFGTARYSSQPAASVVVSDIISTHHLPPPQGRRGLNDAGLQAIEITAQKVADEVDSILSKGWNRSQGKFENKDTLEQAQENSCELCSCGSGIPIQRVKVNEQEIDLAALPLILETLIEKGKAPTLETAQEIMEMLKIYNRIDPSQEKAIELAVLQEYSIGFKKAKK